MVPLGNRSIRFKFLAPHFVAAAVAAIGVAVISSSFGRQRAINDVAQRFSTIESTLQVSSFPLTPAVLSTVAVLTRTELITFDDQGAVVHSTLILPKTMVPLRTLIADSSFVRPERAQPGMANVPVSLGGRNFLTYTFPKSRPTGVTDRARVVMVLCDSELVDQAGRNAALLPLVTGLSSIVILSTLMILITQSFIKRLVRLKQGVERVAGGNFDSAVSDESKDEVGQLGSAVDTMAVQLKQLWEKVNRRQSEKLLHLIAGGMAHQLRNTLTGARMAMELHAQRCKQEEQDDVEVAIKELETAEDYVRRLLLVSAGKQESSVPKMVLDCLDDVQASHMAVAKHLRVALTWTFGDSLKGMQVDDGAAFTAAISNLVLNAMQAANYVDVTAGLFADEESSMPGHRLSVTVRDNGTGVDPKVAAELFEPFVTSKPEGMGLGLPLVKRAAEQMGGDVGWRREDQQTVFEFRCRVDRVEGR